MHIYIKKQDKKTKKSTFKNVSFVWSVHVSFLLGSCALAWVYNIFSSCQTHCSHHIPHTAPALWNNCIFHPFFLSIPCFSLCLYLMFVSLLVCVFSYDGHWLVCVYIRGFEFQWRIASRRSVVHCNLNVAIGYKSCFLMLGIYIWVSFEI